MKQLLQMLRTWWRQDRIRVNRGSGQLLSLQVGERLLIDGDIFTIANRETIKDVTHRAQGDNCQSVVADDTVDVLDAELFDDLAWDAIPTEVEYLLQACADERTPARYPLEDEATLAFSETALCLVARLTVPLAPQESIWLYLDGRQKELWADEIVILPP